MGFSTVPQVIPYLSMYESLTNPSILTDCDRLER